MSIKNRMPLVTIITVVYNGERYLKQTIESVVNQTYKNIEYIIIDGGSTDKTIEIIKDNKEHISYWVSEPDDGLYDAMNKGIGLANGELIGMINSDDWYEENAVELMVNAYTANPEKSIFHADRYDIDENEKKIIYRFNPSELKFKYYGTTYSHPSMFITKEEYNMHKYSTKLKSLSDYQFMLEAYLYNKNTYFYIPKALVNFRAGGISDQFPLKDRIIEGYLARKYAGMSNLENLFSVLLRLTVFSIYKLKG